MAESGLSRSIKSQEYIVSVQLFDRNNREITPTLYGYHILDFGKTLFNDAHRLGPDLKLLLNGSGEQIVEAWTIPAEVFLEVCRTMPFFPISVLFSENQCSQVSVDSDINYMAVLDFIKTP